MTSKKVLIACDSAKSLIDFRGKLVELMRKEHTVYVFTPAIPPEQRAKLALLNIVVFENDLNGSNVSVLSDLKYALSLYRLIKQLKPDVFFPYTLKPVIYGTIAAKLNGVKTITPMLSGLGYNFVTGNTSLTSKITRMLLKFSLRNKSGLSVIFQNKDDVQTLLDSKIISAKHKTAVVNGSGVDLSHYTPTLPDIDNVSFIMVSRLINAKGIREYFEAAQIVFLKHPQVTFKLIGSYDDNVDAIHPDLFSEIKHRSVINYLGAVDDVRPYISGSSVVVLPSYYREGIPRCLLEAMAMGRAIITCDSIGCRETVETTPNANGFLIPVKNAAELVDKMEYFITNNQAISRFGLNGLALAKEKFDVHKVNARMMQIMELN
ncbi:glycosyltransferase family 4 protein [Mucilaginibacter sp. SMC90]|uniref:glycosyltransferase family 4 protein n=1 Tax=Mucilaginibacter sp. SMC90 TaxID=2929803 RepID=UPI001FB42D58|nr:glycosyltransferase family 4 protein [Mucilaginibacter sp. SMC90]UOE51678.1 glycosyltransferase family 4 protein [Mucilaginibacter sp. SMC90]